MSTSFRAFTKSHASSRKRIRHQSRYQTDNPIMSAYDSPKDDVADDQKQKKIEFRFCKECANMLYPREDKTLGTLTFQCRNCQFSEEVGPVCIYRNELSNTVGETSGVTQDVASDPTLPHVDRECPNQRCGARDAVFFQSQQRTAETGMRLFYVCCECGHVWSPIKER
ncbi:hypothetical protein BDZ85DRAFT_259637 [Elsinoe ampelina]|uniref:DNA-directed RNA polymerase II subunit RPB9 n=1 Tax=Elsinoe ampelina TaxID=302913 RepID=A0A6A6GH83_9PEZI|nr:hypothetical protein BDZ85DRAFT_259637 [Elsinoe ampelina]